MVIRKLWFEKYLIGSSYIPFSVQNQYLTEGTEESYGIPSIMITDP
jgi:hypothetical protein